MGNRDRKMVVLVSNDKLCYIADGDTKEMELIEQSLIEALSKADVAVVDIGSLSEEELSEVRHSTLKLNEMYYEEVFNKGGKRQ